MTNKICLFCDEVEEAKPFIDKELKKRTKPTNGDVIRQMSNEELAKIISRSICESCIYQDEDCDCTNHDDGILAWLNAPAESEENNG